MGTSFSRGDVLPAFLSLTSYRVPPTLSVTMLSSLRCRCSWYSTSESRNVMEWSSPPPPPPPSVDCWRWESEFNIRVTRNPQVLLDFFHPTCVENISYKIAIVEFMYLPSPPPPPPSPAPSVAPALGTPSLGSRFGLRMSLKEDELASGGLCLL